MPLPVEAKDILPGFARAYSMRSWKLLKGESDFTTTPKVYPVSPMTKLKSFSGSHEAFCMWATRITLIGYCASV